MYISMGMAMALQVQASKGTVDCVDQCLREPIELGSLGVIEADLSVFFLIPIYHSSMKHESSSTSLVRFLRSKTQRIRR